MMSPYYHEQVCNGKRHYQTWHEADQARKRQSRNMEMPPGRFLHVMRCKVCGIFVVASGFRERGKNLTKRYEER